MRRLVSSVVVALGLVGTGLAIPAPAVAAGKKVCTIEDSKLDELSGLVSTSSGYITVNDSSESSNRKRVFYLDGKCNVTKNVQYSGDGPRDTEDLAVSPDGKTLWIADTGDNPQAAERRSSVALWTMPIGGGSRPVLHRVAYPGGKPHDAEALLVGPGNAPIIITKTGGKAELYSPAAALKTDNDTPVPLKKVGEVTVPKTETDNPFGAVGRLTVTGAARSPDGSRVVLRTYADAFEYDVADGDVVKALTTGEPRSTPLDSDQFGEAIAYSPDGKTFVTVSDLGNLGDDVSNDMFRYTPSQSKPKDPVAAELPAGASGADSGRSWTDDLTIGQITYMVGAIGVLGAVLVGAGIFGILRARRRAAAEPAPLKGGLRDSPSGSIGRTPVPGAAAVASASVDKGFGYDDASWDRRPGGYDDGYRSGRPDDDYQPAGTTYGSARPASSGGGVYGGSGGKSGGGVYGGANGGSGNVYGGGGQSQPPREAGGTYSSGGVYGRPQGGGTYPPDEGY
ncbi:hypothetical protein RB614_18315 [Phytohabitans sp. ZYX-F-186]|uniref:Uncharacterized protein n=1 Tax=Phytohabitans maris TaxID=3071409 RepID=A0ABU0ZIW1_9ACTN|nr:hypothetical protein [Phytohabitans sp. ZYX-F-186]MDQ7906471.1 hypothetical protein [Phytohabitans sp. ZYX-F-186]